MRCSFVIAVEKLFEHLAFKAYFRTNILENETYIHVLYPVMYKSSSSAYYPTWNYAAQSGAVSCTIPQA